MANLTRILFISGEVAPFATESDLASIVRILPEKLQESNEYEMRIMMPRYGTISERRNRLHEVIRLSGTEIQMGNESETLRVKVASIPGIRLQVYFMDNNKYFKRKGIFSDKQGKHFDDNPQRALFFGRATLETILNLGWSPDVVHAFGWMSALVPGLLRTHYSDNPIFKNSKIVYTPNNIDINARFSGNTAEALQLDDLDVVDRDFNEVGSSYSDAVIYPPMLEPDSPEIMQFSDNPEEMVKQASLLYDQVLNGVLA